MKKKSATANLKIVEKETQVQEAEAKSDKITRAEIVERVRKIRRQFEMVRDVHHASMFNDCDTGNDLMTVDEFNRVRTIDELASWINPKTPMPYDAAVSTDPERYYNYLLTGYHIGVFAGVVFTATSPSEIAKAEKGLIFISAAQPWVSKE